MGSQQTEGESSPTATSAGGSILVGTGARGVLLTNDLGGLGTKAEISIGLIFRKLLLLLSQPRFDVFVAGKISKRTIDVHEKIYSVKNVSVCNIVTHYDLSLTTTIVHFHTSKTRMKRVLQDSQSQRHG